MSCNHDCNQGRSCDALGLCQGRTPPCSGCAAKPLNLAPGAIEGFKVGWLGTPAQRRELLSCARYFAGWGAVMVAAGWLLGMVVGVLP